jgi:hypothetical protein
VEEAVGQRVRLEPRDGVRRVVPGVGQKVVPLEYLVQHDAVDEPAEPEAQDEPRRLWHRR